MERYKKITEELKLHTKSIFNETETSASDGEYICPNCSGNREWDGVSNYTHLANGEMRCNNCGWTVDEKEFKKADSKASPGQEDIKVSK